MVVVHGLRCSAACGIFPEQGSNAVCELGPKSGRRKPDCGWGRVKEAPLDQIPAAKLDVDHPLTEEEDEDFEEESDEDDTVALPAELERIQTARTEEQARKEQEQKLKKKRVL
ncbi:hypothetical protein MJG53_018072 [Ovis ammon polii x Ovis aries]|uniref:Uncharacterized protein n=1 Tax=Ovis ammon polii x Ovis aries TaxID=2918886 RepID=A0ACB9U693_9CETA|nr:hypothetical protein MJG53_018072 [Ovis ammon polii x Ovis aries]